MFGDRWEDQDDVFMCFMYTLGFTISLANKKRISCGYAVQLLFGAVFRLSQIHCTI